MNKANPDRAGADPVEEAAAEVEATRAELAETVEELSDRLNPTKQLAREKEAALDQVRARAHDLREGAAHTESAVRDAGSAVSSKVKAEAKDAWETVGRTARSGGGVGLWAGAALVVVAVVVVAARRRNRTP